MKKMLVLVLALVLILSGSAMAVDHVYPGTFANPLDFDDSSQYAEGGDYEDYGKHADDDGTVFFNDVDSDNPGDYTHLEELDRIGARYDTNGRDQDVSVSIDTQAYIPCFLELKLQGNQGTTAAISYGPDANAATRASGYIIAFDNEIGGFLDENWVSLGHGRNAQINPADFVEEEVYIGACDIFSVEVFSNDDYRYSVFATALTAQDNGASVLPMHMRTSLDGGSSWVGGDSGFVGYSTAAGRTVAIATKSAGTKLLALHNFRVPYSMATEHGYYNGEVIFKAATI